MLEEIIKDVLNVQETYAKPVEMTREQYDQFMVFREMSWFSVFMHKQGAQEVPAFSEFISKEREQELMRTWLHPELIKVVE
ncbi:hypothetical protein [Weissella ceti]|nr:hypothetical protein [Weissella ceti]